MRRSHRSATTNSSLHAGVAVPRPSDPNVRLQKDFHDDIPFPLTKTHHAKMEKVQAACRTLRDLEGDGQKVKTRWINEVETYFRPFRVSVVHCTKDPIEVIECVSDEDMDVTWRFLTKLSKDRAPYWTRCEEVLRILMTSTKWMERFRELGFNVEDLPPAVQGDFADELQQVGGSERPQIEFRLICNNPARLARQRKNIEDAVSQRRGKLIESDTAKLAVCFSPWDRNAEVFSTAFAPPAFSSSLPPRRTRRATLSASLNRSARTARLGSEFLTLPRGEQRRSLPTRLDDPLSSTHPRKPDTGRTAAYTDFGCDVTSSDSCGDRNNAADIVSASEDSHLWNNLACMVVRWSSSSGRKRALWARFRRRLSSLGSDCWQKTKIMSGFTEAATKDEHILSPSCEDVTLRRECTRCISTCMPIVGEYEALNLADFWQQFEEAKKLKCGAVEEIEARCIADDPFDAPCIAFFTLVLHFGGAVEKTEVTRCKLGGAVCTIKHASGCTSVLRLARGTDGLDAPRVLSPFIIITSESGQVAFDTGKIIWRLGSASIEEKLCGGLREACVEAWTALPNRVKELGQPFSPDLVNLLTGIRTEILSL